MSPVREQLQRSQRSWEVVYREVVMLRVILSHPVLLGSFINNPGVNTKWMQAYITLLLICRYIYLKLSAHFILMKWLLATFPDNGKVDRKINTNRGKKVRQSDTCSLANWSSQRKCISIQTNAERWTGNKNGGRLSQQQIWQVMAPKVAAVLGINSSKWAPNPKLLQNG